MPVFASPCYKPQNARPGSGRRAKPLTSNLVSWGTTVRVPLGFEPVALPGGHLLPRCYQNARYQECPGRHSANPDRFGLLGLGRLGCPEWARWRPAEWPRRGSLPASVARMGA
jgi:hypothetical protein